MIGSGPLSGIRVIELGGIGPGPFCGMLLADLGADVIRIDRTTLAGTESPHPVLHRNRRSATVDLRHPDGAAAVLQLVRTADVVIEGFRPGVVEKLGVGPEECLEVNPALVYGRMTGWGQDGPMAQIPGHDINYIAISGALGAIGPTDGDPVAPLNVIGDMGGGGMMLAFGISSALIPAKLNGVGQVVDAAITDGTAVQLSAILGLFNRGSWHDRRGVNMLDGAAPFYRTYRCSDGEYMAVGAVESHFYTTMLEILGLDEDPVLRRQHDRESWPEMSRRLADTFARRTRSEWTADFAGRETCVTPVLGLGEAVRHEHNAFRGTYELSADGSIHPTPAPRFDRTPAPAVRRAPRIGEHTHEVLEEAGIQQEDIDILCARGIAARL